MNELAKTGIKFNTLEEICMRAKKVEKPYPNNAEVPSWTFSQTVHALTFSNNEVKFDACNVLNNKSCI